MPPRRAKAQPPYERADDWASTSSSLGGVRDKHVGLTFKARYHLTVAQLEGLYEQNALAARVVDLIVDDAFRHGWTLKNVRGADVDVAKVRSDLEDLGFESGARAAAKWSRLYGGAGLVVAALNSDLPNRQIRLGPNATLLRFVPVPAERILPLKQDVGLLSPTYGRVLLYQINGLASSPVDVHHSRVFPFEPIKLPIEAQRRRVTSTQWGPSILERIWDDLGRYGATMAHATAIMYVATITYLKLTNFRADHNTKEGAAKVRKILESVRQNLDSLGLLGIDKNDEIGALQTGALAGLPELMDRATDRFVASTEYPREIIMHESPAGLNAGELSGPQEIYFAAVRAWQQEHYEPAIDWALDLYFRANKIPVESWDVEFEPLWTPSTTAQSETHARNAAADQIYAEGGAVSWDEIREQRFIDGNAGTLKLANEADVQPALEITPADVQAAEASTTAAAAGAASASSGAAELGPGLVSALLEMIEKFNAHGVTYTQAAGAIEFAFPSLAGRAASVLGPPPADPNALGGVAPAAPDAVGAEPPPSNTAPPADLMSAKDAAAKFGVPTRTISRQIESGALQYWGLGAHKRVSLAEVGALATAHRLPVAPEDAQADAVESRADPLGPYPDFDACVADQTAKGHDLESARKICGAIKAKTE